MMPSIITGRKIERFFLASSTGLASLRKRYGDAQLAFCIILAILQTLFTPGVFLGR